MRIWGLYTFLLNNSHIVSLIDPYFYKTEAIFTMQHEFVTINPKQNLDSIKWFVCFIAPDVQDSRFKILES